MLYHTHICVLSHSCVCILYVIHISVSVYLSWETHISVTDTYTHISVCISNVIHISVSVYIFWETWETLMLRDSHGSQIYWETHRSQICWEICESLKSLKICESLILRDSHISQHICDRWDTHRSQMYVSLSYWETHIYILRDSHILRDLRDSHIERLTSVTDMLRDSHIERLNPIESRFQSDWEPHFFHKEMPVAPTFDIQKHTAIPKQSAFNWIDHRKWLCNWLLRYIDTHTFPNSQLSTRLTIENHCTTDFGHTQTHTHSQTVGFQLDWP